MTQDHKVVSSNPSPTKLPLLGSGTRPITLKCSIVLRLVISFQTLHDEASVFISDYFLHLEETLRPIYTGGVKASLISGLYLDGDYSYETHLKTN